MTEQELREIKEQVEFMGDQWFFYAPANRLLDEVEQLKKRIRIIVKVESKLHYSDLENERLRKTLEEIAQAEPLSITHDIGYMQHIARKALEGKE